MKKIHWIGVIAFCFIALLVVGTQIVIQANSFTIITFTTNSKTGTAILHSNTTNPKKITPNEPLRLKKGEYTVTTQGDNIANMSHTIQIDGSKQIIPITFSFTRTYLDTLFNKEQAGIHTTIAEQFPQLEKLYTIHNEALYDQGDYYGATLRFIDTKSDQRDTLHILLHKKEGTWRVLSQPPVPVLSAPLYPDISSAALKEINQGE